MKALHTLLIILLISLSKSLECIDKTVPNNKKDCNDRTPGEGYVKCCYVKNFYYDDGSLTNSTGCSPIDQTHYDNLAKKLKSIKGHLSANGAVIDSFVFDCSSKYLYISLLSLMVFLI